MGQEFFPVDDPPTDSDGLTPLGADTIGYLASGYPKEKVRQMVRAIRDDLINRGSVDGKARKLSIELVFRMKRGKIEVEVEMSPKFPKEITYSTQLTTDRNGDLAYRYESPANADQPTLPMPRVAAAE